MTNTTKKTNEEQQNRYRKKTIFWLSRSWRIYFNMIWGTLWFLIIIFGIGMLIYQWNAAKNELQQYQALQVFLKVDDFAHTQTNKMMTMTWIRDGLTRIEEFEKIDNKFHTVPIFTERYKYTQQMDVFIGRLNDYLNNTLGTDTPEFQMRNETYNNIHNAFIQMQGTLYPNK